MVENATVAGVRGVQEEPAGVIRLRGADHGNFELLVDAVAYDVHQRYEVCALSACGSNTEVSAFRAALHLEDADIEFEFEQYGGTRKYLYRDKAGYRTQVATLGDTTKHLVAWSKRPGLVLSLEEEGVWQHLVAETTTPIHRAWMPWLLGQLEEAGLTRPVWSVGPNMNVGMVGVTTQALDGLVQKGLRRRQLKIVA